LAFQLKDWRSIVASMVNHLRAVQSRLTDFNVGSVARTLVEAPAVEIDELYQQMFFGLKESIPVAIYTSFDFARLPAAAAYGDVRLYLASAATTAVVIPAGTVVRVPGGAVGYATQTQAVIAQGQTQVSARVAADTSGVAGNASAGTITALDAPISGVSVVNDAAFVTGRDEETDAERKIRFAQYVAALSRAPLAAIEYGARTVALYDELGGIGERVVSAKVIEPYLSNSALPLGYCNCYVWNGVDGASAALVAEAQRVIDGYVAPDGTRVMGWKAAGVVCAVAAVTVRHEPVTITVTAEADHEAADLMAPVAEVLGAYLTALEVGEKALVAEMIGRVMAVSGVYNARLAAPAGDVAPGGSGKIMPGTITVVAG
jgi:uncharacterized phage protein gp47/JayE